MTERDEFEKWFAATRPSKHRPNFALREDGTYVDDHTQRHWWTWQNAVLAERERCAKECDKIGERHRKMNDSRPPELMTSGENAAYECADAIRNGTP